MHLHLHLIVNEPEHSHFMLNNEIIVFDTEKLETFLLSAIICPYIVQNILIKLLEITSKMSLFFNVSNYFHIQTRDYKYTSFSMFLFYIYIHF